MQGFDFFRSEAGQGKKLENSRRKFGPQFVVELARAAEHQLADFGRDRFADSGDFLEPVFHRELAQISAPGLDRSGGVGVSADFKRILFLKLEQGRDRLEQVDNSFFFYFGHEKVLPGKIESSITRALAALRRARLAQDQLFPR